METVRNFLWWCAGVNKDYLLKYPQEFTKYVCIGATIFLTAILATLTGGYAFHTIFNSIGWTVLFALIWGVFIFNLDRYIVSSLQKKSRWLDELPSASPRLLVAIVISVVISNPLELKIFEKEINSKIERNLETFESELKKTSKFTTQLNELDNKTNSNASKVEADALRAEKTRLDEELIKEIQGRVGSGKVGDGPAAQQIKKRISEIVIRLNVLEPLNNSTNLNKETRASQLEKERDDEVQRKVLEKRNSIAFAARNDVLGQLTEESKFIFWTKWFITFLFFVIEIAPILVKLFSEKGEYDYYLDKLKKDEIISNEEDTNKKVRQIAVNKETETLNAVEGLREQHIVNQKLSYEARIDSFFQLREKVQFHIFKDQFSDEQTKKALMRSFDGAIVSIIQGREETYSTEQIRILLDQSVASISQGSIDNNSLRNNIKELSDIIKELPESIVGRLPTVTVYPNK